MLPAPETIAVKLETVFGAIRDTRMRDVPILNEAMPVKAVGFREWGGHWLGVLITPWFMNLMLLPRDGAAEDTGGRLPLGEKETHGFPAGNFAFIQGEEDGLGRYQMCSLFSPMFDFAEAEAAVATAEAVMVSLFEGGEAMCLSAEERELEAMRSGKPMPEETPEPPQQAGPPKPLSRRALITGFQAGGGKDAG